MFKSRSRELESVSESEILEVSESKKFGCYESELKSDIYVWFCNPG